jgi:hypothetical protein
MAIARNPVLAIDCPDPAVLAEFYGAILGWTPSVDPDGSWADIRSGDRLTMRAYERTGGIDGAVARLAERAFDQLAPGEAATARNMLVRLAGAGETEAVRRQVPLAELDFQRVEAHNPPQWPGQEVPQQMHLDVDVDDLDEAEGAVLALGAVKHDHQPGTTYRVFLDPAGHPFCLCLADD